MLPSYQSLHPSYFIWSTLSEAATTAVKCNNNNFQFNSNIIEIHQRCCCCYRFPRNHNKNIFYRNFSLRHIRQTIFGDDERSRECLIGIEKNPKRVSGERIKKINALQAWQSQKIVKLHLQID